MSEDTGRRRATRRNRTTQPLQGRPTLAQQPKLSPITPDELAHIIAEARTQRTEEDIQAYAERKAS